MRSLFRGSPASQLPAGYDVDKHFNPTLRPVGPAPVPGARRRPVRGALRTARASIATGEIETFTETGVRLDAGEELEADIIVTATGLNMLHARRHRARASTARQSTSASTVAYKGMMLCGVPNMALTLGYTNASWTLKADLVAEYVCRLLNHMDAQGVAICTPRRPHPALPTDPIIDLQVRLRAALVELLPKQGASAPWRLHQNYVKDVRLLRRGPLDDACAFASRPPGATSTRHGLRRERQTGSPAGPRAATRRATARSRRSDMSIATAAARRTRPRPARSTACPRAHAADRRCRRSRCARASGPTWSAPGAATASMFTVHVVGLGTTVIVSDPELIKQAFRADPTVLHAGTAQPVAGAARQELAARHRRGPAHGAAQAAAAAIQGPADEAATSRMIAEIAAEEIDRWPQDVEFDTTRLDAAHHAARDPARGLRRRGRASARARRAAAAMDGARRAAGAGAASCSTTSVRGRRGTSSCGCARGSTRSSTS